MQLEKFVETPLHMCTACVDSYFPQKGKTVRYNSGESAVVRQGSLRSGKPLSYN